MNLTYLSAVFCGVFMVFALGIGVYAKLQQRRKVLSNRGIVFSLLKHILRKTCLFISFERFIHINFKSIPYRYSDRLIKSFITFCQVIKLTVNFACVKLLSLASRFLLFWFRFNFKCVKKLRAFIEFMVRVKLTHS